MDEKGNSISNASLTVATKFANKNECISVASSLSSQLKAQGYAAASIDTIYEDSEHVFVKIFQGEKYVWDNISIESGTKFILNDVGYSSALLLKKPYNQSLVSKIFLDVLSWCANNGYPFASISFDSITINKEKISAKMILNKGAPYYIDSIIYSGGVKISKSFIEKYIGLAPHSLYNKEKMENIKQRISALPYLQLSQPVNVEMLNTGALIHLDLQALRSNSINVLIGLLPNNTQTNGKLLFTGDATIGLRNSLGKGETIGINWQQLQPQSPRLNLAYQQPYIFNSNFGTNFNFELYKRDSFFVNIKSQIGLEYEFAQNQFGSLLLQFAATNVLSVDTNIVKATNALPDIADVNTAGFAMQYNFFNTNYRFNPRKGNELNATIIAASRNIKRNNTILQIKDPVFNADSLYNGVQTNSYQLKFQTVAAHYFPIGKQSAIKTAINSGWIISPSNFQNEMFQIGGIKTMRGFDEESIFTNGYAIFTAEYRYLLDKNSWLYTFTDYGYAAYKSISANFSHTYLGLGLGMSLETNAGIFNIAFAQGKRNDTKFDFSQSKIHIGFVSLF